MVLRVERVLYIHSPHLQSLPDRDSNSQPFDYESDSLPLGHDFPVMGRVGYRLVFFRYRCQIDTFKKVPVPKPILIKM